jgi:hypothetical protein
MRSSKAPALRHGGRRPSPVTSHPLAGGEKITCADHTVWTDTGGFRGVPELIWNFHVGGYQVCENWRRGCCAGSR